MDAENARTKNVKVNTMTKKDFCCLFTSFTSLIVVILLIATFGAPAKYNTLPPTNGQNIDIRNFVCTQDYLEGVYEREKAYCWSHRFIFASKLTQYFSLDMILHRSKANTDKFAKSINLHILWQGTLNYQEDKAEWVTIADSDVVRKAEFEDGSVNSTDLLVFKANSIQYQAYFFQVAFLDPESATAFMEAISFQFLYENWNWMAYQIGFKTSFLLASIAVAIVYSVYLRSVKRRLRSYEQRWVRVLTVALIFYNNPVFFLQFVAPRKIFGWTDTIFQVSFFAILLLYWLITFDGMTKDPPFAFKKFYLPKMIFVFIYWFVGVGIYLGIQAKEWNEPLFNWYQDDAIVKFSFAYLIISGVSYVIFLLVLLIRGVLNQANMTSRQRVTFAYHTVIVLITFIGSIVGSLITSFASRVSDYVFMYALFNFYVFSLAYLYSPTSEANITMEAGDMAPVNVPDYGGSIVPNGKAGLSIQAVSAGSSPMRLRMTPTRRQQRDAAISEAESGRVDVSLVKTAI